MATVLLNGCDGQVVKAKIGGKYNIVADYKTGIAEIGDDHNDLVIPPYRPGASSRITCMTVVGQYVCGEYVMETVPATYSFFAIDTKSGLVRSEMTRYQLEAIWRGWLRSEVPELRDPYEWATYLPHD